MAFNKKMEENLVGTHPRDALLVLRQDNLEVKKVKERKEALIKARTNYDSGLKEFAKKFLADENISLPPAQKEELAKIYASRCKKQICLISGSLLLLFTGITLGIYYHPAFITTLIIGGPIGFTFIEEIIDRINFLRAKKILKTASTEELKSLDSEETRIKERSKKNLIIGLI